MRWNITLPSFGLVMYTVFSFKVIQQWVGQIIRWNQPKQLQEDNLHLLEMIRILSCILPFTVILKVTCRRQQSQLLTLLHTMCSIKLWGKDVHQMHLRPYLWNDIKHLQRLSALRVNFRKIHHFRLLRHFSQNRHFWMSPFEHLRIFA